ncbi:MAG: class I SAM-dependent methyltransferase [Candidatus Hodarchaeales archaeon]
MSTEENLSDGEYRNYFTVLAGLRRKIADLLPIRGTMKILDLATGYGYFSFEILKSSSDKDVSIIGIDISRTDVDKANRFARDGGFAEFYKALEMDAVDLGFPGGNFDMVVNFFGLEDIHMTRGREGVEKTIKQVSRVLKPGGYFVFIVLLPEMMDSKAQQLEVAIFSYICDATWLSYDEYRDLCHRAGLQIIDMEQFTTGKKLSQEQAKEEIKFACDNVPLIYGKETPSFEDVWGKYGDEIVKHGLGHYSKVSMFITKKKE